MYTYMLLSFDVGIIYLLTVDKCMHLINGGTRSDFIRFYYGALLSRLLEILSKSVIIIIKLNKLVHLLLYNH